MSAPNKVMIGMLAILLNLVLPGAGLTLKGHKKAATAIASVMLATLTALAATRLITKADFFSSYLLLWISLSTIASTGHFISKEKAKPILILIVTAATSLIILLATTTSQYWLGLKIYFVPSMSMHPALKPGQFIIIDTLAYKAAKPKIGDIIVFRHSPNWLVKRITKKAQKGAESSEEWFVMGDNRDYSQDSRHFGSIKTEKIDGKVTFILLSLSEDGKISSPILKSVE